MKVVESCLVSPWREVKGLAMAYFIPSPHKNMSSPVLTRSHYSTTVRRDPHYRTTAQLRPRVYTSVVDNLTAGYELRLFGMVHAISRPLSLASLIQGRNADWGTLVRV